MASEIRVNKIENRSGLGTVTFADTGVDLAGIVTATTFSGSGASLTNLPAASLTGTVADARFPATLPAASGANLTNLPAANLTGALPAISGANLTGIAATDNVRTGILDVAGIATFRSDVNIPNINGGQIGGRRNIVTNGAMQVAQRATSVTVTNSVRGFQTLDRFEYNIHGTTTHEMTMEQSSESPDGFSNSLKLSTTTADASLTGTQSHYLNTEIEAQDLQQLAYGTSSAKSFTLSFYVKSTITGTYVVWFYSSDTSKALTKTYTISSANTWERKTITVAGDTSSAINNDNGSGMFIRWILGAGPDYSSGSASTTWSTDGYTNTNRYVGQTANIAATTSDNWAITGVQFELGSQATAFEHRSFAEELALCQRYYYKHAFGGSVDGNLGISNNNMAVGMCAMYTSSAGFGYIPYPVTMRALPTLENATGTDYYRVYARGGADNFNDISTQQFGVNGSVINYYDGFARTQGDAGWIQIYNTNAYIAFNAEL